MKITKEIFSLLFCTAYLLFGCSKAYSDPPTNSDTGFVKGADPGKQNKPAAWVGHDFTQLLTDVYDYTADVMTSLKANGITPEWVQIGNEIPGGMIYPEGSNSNFGQLVQLINKGYDATKDVSPSSKVILHVDQGNNNGRFRWWFDNAKANGAKYDVIGLSYFSDMFF